MRNEDGGFVDLHIHSNYSDGVLSPSEIVGKARRVGLKAISIADHDCVDGVELGVKAGRENGIEVISGVEMSVRTGEQDVHLLGYFVDTENEGFRKYLEFFKETRAKRARKIVDRLNELGVALELSTVMEVGGDGSVGRMHIAKAMVKDKFCRNIDIAFSRYLRDGGPAFVKKYRISAEEAVDIIHKANGLALLAHPGFYASEALISYLFDVGLDGLEVYNPKHSEFQVSRFQTLVREHKGVESGGSDFHGGKERPSRLGFFKAPYSLVVKMKEYSEGSGTS
jgi:predicted metal-dependent phosphoesterase TrpH